MIVNQNNFNSVKKIIEKDNPNFEVLEISYKQIKNKDSYRNRTYLDVKHLDCGRAFSIPTAKLKDTINCPGCVYKKKDHNTFKKEFDKSSKGEYELLSEYKNVQEKIKVKHLKCGHIYEVTPNKWLAGRRCPDCFGPKQMNKEKFKKIFGETSNSEYELLTDYQRTNIKIKVKHLKCGHIYEVTPNKWLAGRRCPECAPTSYGEIRIKKLLENLSCNFKRQFRFKDCRDQNQLPFDFAVFKKNSNELLFLIEFDGWQHRHYRATSLFNKTKEDLELVQYHDKIKTEYCEKNKIPLLRIEKLKDIEPLIKQMFNDYPDRE